MTTTFNIYSRGWAGHAGWPRFQKRNSDCAVRQRIATRRHGETRCHRPGGAHPFAASHDDKRRDGSRSLPLTLVTGAGAAARNSIGLVLVGGMTIGTIFTLFIVPSLYMLIAKEHHQKSLMDPDLEEPEDVDVTSELEPALARDGNGNGWKQA